MAQRSKIALIYGGKSGEHEVSLRSAASVFHHLCRNKFDVTAIALDKEGQIFVQDDEALQDCGDSLPVHHPAARALPSLIHNNRFAVATDCVFPVIHGPLYEDGCLQGLLEISNTPYVGCDVLSCALGMDKDIARRLACHDSLPCARYGLVDWHMNKTQRHQILQSVIDDCGFPLFVKPCSLGSSVGIHKVHNEQEAHQAITDALCYDQNVLIEEALTGREIELAVLENKNAGQDPLCSIPGEIRMRNDKDFYSYDVKYQHPEQCELLVPAPLPAPLVEKLQKQAITVFKTLKCKGMARVDFFVNAEGGEIYFNEINTLPGFTSISMYPRLWEASGIGYPQLLEELINLALRQQAWRKQRITSYL